MSPVWGLLVLVVLFMMGMPVAYAIGISSVVIMAASTGIKWVTISSAMIQGLDSFTILCIPLFLLSGKLMNRCGITDRLFTFCRALVGWFPGGLGHVNVLASFIFAGMSGTAVADAAGLGQIEIRAMEANGYDRDFSAAVTAASSTLGPLIPPSLVLVVYGMVSGESVGALFMAGILPGVVMALLMMGLVTYYAIKNQYPRDPFPTGKQVLEAFRGGILPLMTPIIILLGIYTGIFTPTEAAAVCLMYAAFIGIFVYKAIDIKGFMAVVQETVREATPICAMVGISTLLGNVLTQSMIPQTLMGQVLESVHSKWVFLLLLNVGLLIVGMFMDSSAAITILTPIIYPIAIGFGINGIHLGVVMILNIVIGVLSPPFGVVLFTLERVAKLPMKRLIKALLPWFAILLLALAVVTIFPSISTFIPSKMGFQI